MTLKAGVSIPIPARMPTDTTGDEISKVAAKSPYFWSWQLATYRTRG